MGVGGGRWWHLCCRLTKDNGATLAHPQALNNFKCVQISCAWQILREQKTATTITAIKTQMCEILSMLIIDD